MSNLNVSHSATGSNAVSPPHPPSPTLRRGRGRPRHAEEDKGKAPMESPAPKRQRGRPRKAEASTSQPPVTSLPVSFHQFFDTTYDLYARLQSQKDLHNLLEREYEKDHKELKERVEYFRGLGIELSERVKTVEDVQAIATETIGYIDDRLNGQRSMIDDLRYDMQVMDKRMMKVEAGLRDVVRHLRDRDGYLPPDI